MTVTAEQIAAFVDDELDATARAQVAEAALRDPAIAARIAAERDLRETLRAHFAPMADLPVPQDWVDTIRQARADPVVTSLDAMRARRSWGRGWAGAAMAASLVIGVGIGAQLHRDGPLVAGPGGLIAAGDLARTLDRQLASAQDGAPIRILGTFRRQGGDLCRVFAGAVASGIACHGHAGWQMEQVRPGVAPERGAYAQAGSGEGDLMAAAQAMATGDPLDADHERTAREHGWQ
ncbi:hypothetical protein [Novosphingobium sp. FSW06-99]|uniref:hypothetical protein n=1 Tax=Novosphingobium sp. FSW06-99 TaxID=1739113 RepID=UPI00076C2248|nr:hypothetical protein [Novosphingobium sp. FSW06-99]KUR76025.1 hypothetical protein AQZ49_13415 [Novosphingobium sp. FSW06-99]